MSCNILLQYCTRHVCTLPLLTDLEVSRDASLRGLGSFTKAVTRTPKCALGERALSRCTPEFWQTRATKVSPRNHVTPLYDVLPTYGARHVECCHH
jgi:hypothetical protein